MRVLGHGTRLMSADVAGILRQIAASFDPAMALDTRSVALTWTTQEGTFELRWTATAAASTPPAPEDPSPRFGSQRKASAAKRRSERRLRAYQTRVRAALKLQRAFRATRTRKPALESKRHRDAAATRIQAAFRGLSAHLRARRPRHPNGLLAAIDGPYMAPHRRAEFCQSPTKRHGRAWQAYKLADACETRAQRLAAATRIQSAARGHAARRRMGQLRAADDATWTPAPSPRRTRQTGRQRRR